MATLLCGYAVLQKYLVNEVINIHFEKYRWKELLYNQYLSSSSSVQSPYYQESMSSNTNCGPKHQQQNDKDLPS